MVKYLNFCNMIMLIPNNPLSVSKRYKLYIKHYFHYLKNRYSWGNSYPKFTRLIYVNPEKINYRVDPGLNIIYDINREPHLLGDNWDKSPVSNEIWYSRHRSTVDSQVKLKLDNYLVYISMRQRYNELYEWEKTDIYKFIKNNNGIEKKYHAYDAPKSMKNRLTKCDQLYYQIRNEGYQTQRDLKTTKIYPEYGEVLVHIGRNGTIFLGQGGRHRLGISKILDVERIPVRVSVRHKKWQELRYEIYKKGLSEEHKNLRGHPDLQDVIN